MTTNTANSSSKATRIRQLLERPLYRYILIGGATYVIELLVILLAQRAGAGTVLAVAISFWVGLLVSFVLQKVVSFRDRRMHHKIVIPQLIAFCLLVAFNFTFTVVVVDILKNTFPVVVTRTIAVGITTFWNFYLYKTRIFKQVVID